MAASEKAFQERQRRELVALMPLATMFPDRQVRALAEAAGEGNVRKIEELVAGGIDVNSRGKQDATLLFWALRKGNIDGFEKLLALGADPNVVFADASVMHWATIHRDTSFLLKALDYGGNPNIAAGTPSQTPLFDAFAKQDSDRRDTMLILLDAGANINAQTGEAILWGRVPMGGQTPVVFAAAVGRYDIVYELLDLGADYRIKDVNGRGLVDRIVARKARFFSDGDLGADYRIKVISGHGLVDRVVDRKARFFPDRDLGKSFEKVITWLSERGVTIPE